MSVARLLTHRATVQRQTPDATGIGRSYLPIATDVPCLIQPLDDEATENVASSFAKDFKVYFLLSADVKEGDRLIDQDGRSLGVRGTRRRDYGPAPTQHLEVLAALDRSAA